MDFGPPENYKHNERVLLINIHRKNNWCILRIAEAKQSNAKVTFSWGTAVTYAVKSGSPTPLHLKTTNILIYNSHLLYPMLRKVITVIFCSIRYINITSLYHSRND